VTVAAGATLTFTNTATDTDQPPQTLTFSLPVAPNGATIAPAAGIFSWTPNSAQYGSTNPVSIVVTDNGTPSLSATQSFNAMVMLPRPPVMGAFSISVGNPVFSGTGGIPNATLYLLGSTNLSLPASNWTRLLTNQFDASGNFNFTNPLGVNPPQSFYLLQLP
jgi:hypothetical protein